MPKAKKTRPKKPPTPKTIVRNALRKLWLQSRERSAALRRENYTCQRCGKKQSKAKGHEVKIHAHHIYGVEWGDLVDLIFERLLQTPDAIELLCVDCHDAEHAKEDAA
jgi:5-methylcytosine-specific restriction endonuclease McrA